MTAPEFFLSLLCLAGIALVYWGVKDRHRRHNEQYIPSPMPDGDYYFGVDINEVDKKMIRDHIMKSLDRQAANSYLLYAAENYCHQQNHDNLIELYQAKEKVKSFNQ